MKFGLRSKMLIPTIGAVIVCMALSTSFSTRKASDELWKELRNASKVLAQNLTSGVGEFAEDVLGAVVLQSKNDRIRKTLAEPSENSLKEGRQALTDLSKFNASVQAANLLNEKGDTIASSDPSAKGNFADREYFKKAMNGEANISEPFMSRITNKPVFVVAAPIMAGDKPIGVIYARVDLGRFSEKTVDMVKVGHSGYALMASKSGVVFSHPDKSQLLKLKLAETSWGKPLLATDSGVSDFNENGTSKAAIFSRDAKTGWMAAIIVSSEDIGQASSSVRNANMLFGALSILLVSLAVVLVLGHMLKSLTKCVDYAASVTSGNLQCSLDEKRDDELGRLAQSLCSMVESLRDMIGTAKQKTSEAEQQTELARVAMAEAEASKADAVHARQAGMLQAAQQLESIVEVVTNASDELANQITQSSRGAENQAMRVSETATAMEEMTATVIEVARNAGKAAETSGSARGKAQGGAQIVGRVVESMNNVQMQTDQLKVDMGQLGKQAEDIGRIMTVITDIADQTNLLALNAAIEAARAGDAGRGFAVVADEVRKLAEKTMQATKEVGDAIGVIQKSTRLNVESVEKSVQLIQTATSLAQDSGAALGEIVELVDTASDQVRSIATASEEQSASSEEINRSIEQVNIISGETSQAMREASRAVAELTEQSKVLKQLIAKLEQEGRG